MKDVDYQKSRLLTRRLTTTSKLLRGGFSSRSASFSHKIDLVLLLPPVS